MGEGEGPVRAYRAAWDARASEGTDDEVLQRRLRTCWRQGAEPKTPAVEEFFLDLWRDGATPAQVRREVRALPLKRLKAYVAVVRMIWGFIRQGGTSTSADIPAHLKALWFGRHDDDHCFYSSDLLCTLSCSESELERLLPRGIPEVTKGEEVGLRGPIGVWLDMESEPGSCAVRIGSATIGNARLSVDVWGRMRAARSEGLVSDGHLDAFYGELGSVMKLSATFVE